jgi:hypothetical protein
MSGNDARSQPVTRDTSDRASHECTSNVIKLRHELCIRNNRRGMVYNYYKNIQGANLKNNKHLSFNNLNLHIAVF